MAQQPHVIYQFMNSNVFSSWPAFWRRRVFLLRVQVNVGWVLELSRGPLLVLMAVGALVVFVLRRVSLTFGAAMAVLGVMLGLGLVVGIWRARLHWIGNESALARLDWMLGQHSRLSAAAQGVGAWPLPMELPQKAEAFSWKIVRAHSGWGGALLLGAAGLLIPLEQVKVRPTQLPPALVDAEALIKHLEQNVLLDAENIRLLKTQLEQLQKKDPAEWYSHTNLEAAAQLKSEVEAGARETAEQLAKAENALMNSGPGGEQGNAEQLNETLAALQNSKVGMNPAASESLRKLAQKNGGRMSEAEAAAAAAELRRARDAMQNGESKSQLANGSNTFGEAESEAGRGKEQGSSRAEGEPGTGQGDRREEQGKSRLTYSTKETRLQSLDFYELPEQDNRTPAPGEWLQDVRAVPTPAPVNQAGAGGAAAAQARVSGVVSTQRPLPPQDQQRLRRYFSP